MKSNPALSVSLRCVLAVSLLVCLALFGAWRVHSTLASVERFAQTAELSRQQVTEATQGQPLVDREQRQREVQTLRSQAWWTVAVMVFGAAVIVGRLLTITSIVRHESSEWETLEKHLREREARLQAILDSEPECVKLIASDGTLLEMNAAGLEMIEVGSASQIIGQRVESLVAPEYRSDFLSLNERVFRGEAGTLEFEVIGLKGGRRWLDTHASPLRDDRGQVIALLGITRDITPRKQAEEALRQANAQLAATLDALPDLMFEVDATGRIFDFRAPQNDRLFVQSTQFLGKRMRDVLPIDAAKIIEGAVEEADSLGMHQGATYSLDLPRGKSWFELSIARKGQGLGDNARFVLLARDITDRIRIEQELRASQASLEEAQAIASLGSWKFDTDRRIGAWSSEMFRLFDREPNQGTPSFENYLETIHPEDRHLLPEANVRAIETDERPEIVYRTNPACGPLRYFSGRVQANRDAHGRVVQLSGTLWDVTQLKQADEALRDSEERFRVLIDQAADSMFVHDFDGKLLDVNRSACESLGYSREELLKLPVTVFETGAPLAALQEMWNGLQASDPFTVIGRHRRKDGTEFPVEVRVGLIESGGVSVILALVRNISERKIAEDALQASETRYRLLADNTDDFVSLVDTQGNRLYFSPSYFRVTGWTPEEIQRTDWRVRLHPDELPMIEQTRAANLAGETTTIEHRVRCKTGAWLWVELKCKPLMGPDGRVQQLLLWGRDITDRKRTESLVRGQSQVLETIARGAPLTESLIQLLQLLETQSPDMVCSVLLLDDDGVHLRHGAGPSLPDEYNRAIDGVTIGPNVGSCGTAAFRGESIIVEDIASDPLWANFKDLALSHGLRACWSTPILDSQQQVLGTFAVYYREPAQPTALHLRLMEIAIRIATIAIGKQRAEEALRASDARLRMLVDQMPAALWAVDRDLQITSSTGAALKQLGLRPGQLVGVSLFEYFQTEDSDFVPIASHRRALAGETVEYEFDWSGRMFTTHIEPLRDEAKNITGALGLSLDITERMRTEKALHESNAQYRLLADNTDDFVQLLDLKGSRLYLSPSYLRATGWTLEEIQNSDWRNHMNADDLPKLERARSIAMAGETSLTEHRIRRKDDSWIWVELRFKPILDQDGRVFQILQVSRDITERKRAESALRESEAMLELILDSIPQGVFWKNRQSVYLGANRVARLAMGLTGPHTVPGLTDFDVPTFRPEEAELFVGKDREVMDSDQSQFAIVETMTLPDGSTNWIETNKLPMHDADGNVSGLLGTWENITERKLANEELQSSRERLAVLSRQLIAAQESERRDVARELHDEIGQVLTAVGLNLHHLKSVCGFEANAELDAGLTLINQAMIQVRELSLNLRPPMLDVLGLDAAIRSCVEQHRKQTGCDVQLDLRLETRLSSELEITCYRIVQSALTNIARHARASQVLVELRQNELGLELVVRDNGVGFDLESVRQRSNQGESFGILAMQERVHLVGGTLRIDSASTPGVGTSIHAHLPFAKTSASQEAFA